MMDIESQLRKEMRAEALRARPEDLRPLGTGPLDTRPASTRPGFWRPAQNRWLVPAAAAMAMIATIAGVTVAARDFGVRTDRSASQHLAGARFGKPPWPISQGGVPPYFVSLSLGRQTRPGGPDIAVTAQVHASATGAILRTIRLPDYAFAAVTGGHPLITAAGDNLRFVLAIPTGTRANPATRFYLLTLGWRGGSASVTPLPIAPVSSGAVTSIALKPDGTELAIAILSPGQPGATFAVREVSLRTSATRTWWAFQSGLPPAQQGSASELRWVTDGPVLSFLWLVSGYHDAAGLYILNTAIAGDNLLAARKILTVLNRSFQTFDAYLAADQKTVIASIDFTSRFMAAGYPAIAELSARTGQVLRYLYRPPRAATRNTDDVVAADASGNHILVEVGNTPPHATTATSMLGRIDDGIFSRLTWPPAEVPAIAW